MTNGFELRPLREIKEAKRLANAERQRRFRERRRTAAQASAEAKSDEPAPSPPVEPEAQRELTEVERGDGMAPSGAPPMSVTSRAAKLSDSRISSEDVRQKEQLRAACAQHLSDLRREMGTPLRSYILRDEADT